MANFLEKAQDLLEERALKDTDGVKALFSLRQELEAVYAKSSLNLNNVEVLFGLVEMASITHVLGDHDARYIEDTRTALISLIAGTLEESIGYSLSSGEVRPPAAYRAFVDLVGRLSGRTTIVTFNYDVALDYSLFFGNRSFGYHLGSTGSMDTKLLKLHGSLNWGKALGERDSTIVPLPIEAFMRLGMPRLVSNSNNFPVRAVRHLSEELQRTHPDMTFDKLPVLVPPTWNKTDYSGALSAVWQAAAHELQEARNVYIVGYSMPESDSFFRYLFALGTLKNVRLRRLWVFDKADAEGEVHQRYRSMIGTGIRDSFRYIPLRFANLDQFHEW